MNSKELLKTLLDLQALEFDETELDGAVEREMEKKIAALRLQIPLPMLNHYDRLRVRGKKGVAAVRNQTCSGCHVQVTRAIVINLMHGDDIQVCENCGRYLYLPVPNEQQVSPQPVKLSKVKTGKKTELAYAA